MIQALSFLLLEGIIGWQPCPVARGKLRRTKTCLIDVLWEEQIFILEDKRIDVKGEQRQMQKARESKGRG